LIKDGEKRSRNEWIEGKMSRNEWKGVECEEEGIG